MVNPPDPKTLKTVVGAAAPSVSSTVVVFARIGSAAAELTMAVCASVIRKKIFPTGRVVRECGRLIGTSSMH
jgi:hypothetical protein